MIEIAEKIVNLTLPAVDKTRTVYKEEIRQKRNCYICEYKSHCSKYTQKINRCMPLNVQKDMYKIIDFFADIRKELEKSKKEEQELVFKISISNSE